MKQFNKKPTKAKGFTLIELLIVSSLFSIILIALSGLFISALKVEQNILGTKKLLGQTSYAMEYMTRALRMAKKDKTGACITSGHNYEISGGGTAITFINSLQGDACQKFFLSGKQLQYDNSLNILDLTSTDVSVESLKFALSGDSGGDVLQPFITMYLETKTKNASAVKLQTSVSQRNPDTH